MSEHPEVAKVCPGLQDCFPGPPSLLRAGLVLQLDKLICFLLHLGRSNHVMHDSDRSRPILLE